MESFEKELTELINRHSMENGSDTPDFILANYLINCLANWNFAILSRETWYGRFVAGENPIHLGPDSATPPPTEKYEPPDVAEKGGPQ